MLLRLLLGGLAATALIQFAATHLGQCGVVVGACSDRVQGQRKLVVPAHGQTNG
jgi:hypothetical protein